MELNASNAFHRDLDKTAKRGPTPEQVRDFPALYNPESKAAKASRKQREVPS